MPKFNLKDYETVDERIQRFYRAYPEGRITTELVDFSGDHGSTRWVVKASVFTDSEEPKGTGFAFEVDGTGMANNTSALENSETSAVGRALAQAGYSGSRRTTFNEMAKVLLPELWQRIKDAKSKDDTRAIWTEAQKNGVLDEVKQAILDRNEELSNGAA